MAEPVVGMVFSVAADSPGQAVQTAVEVATDAIAPNGRDLYGASVFPHKAAPADRKPGYPSLDDWICVPPMCR